MPKTLAELFGDTEATPVEAPTPGPTPVSAAAPDISAPEPAATPPQTGPTLAQLLGTPAKVVKGAGAILDPSVRTASVPTTLSQTADDRTIMQRYGLGTVRQATAAFLDYSTGIPFAGVSWLAAGMQAASRAMPPGMSDALQFAAKNINKGVGEGLHLIEEVAGRPVVEIPSWVPVVGGQDAIRTIGMFAPLPFVAGEQMVAKGGMAALKTFGKAFGIQLAFTEAGAAMQLAQAETKEQTYDALVEMGKGIGSAAVATAFFGGLGALHETINKQRIKYAIDKAKGAVTPDMTAGEAALGTAIAHDANTGGSLIGDELARAQAAVKTAKENLANVPRGTQATIITRPPATFYTTDRVRTPDGRSWLVTENSKGGKTTISRSLDPDEIPAFPEAEMPLLEPQERILHHGSPYEFDKFDVSKIGTGEGAQAYTRGLYFAEAEKLAKGYAAKLVAKRASLEMQRAARLIEGMGPNEPGAKLSDKFKEMAITNLESRIESARRIDEMRKGRAAPYEPEPGMEFAEWEKSVRASIDLIKNDKTGGFVYRVGVPEEAFKRMWDWEKPIPEQPDIIKKLPLSELGIKVFPDPKDKSLSHVFVKNPQMEMKGGTFENYQSRSQGLKLGTVVGTPVVVGDLNYQRTTLRPFAEETRTLLNSVGRTEAFRLKMQEKGVAGVKYQDGNSRHLDPNSRLISHNYVIFDDAHTRIIGEEPLGRGGVGAERPSAELPEVHNLKLRERDDFATSHVNDVLDGDKVVGSLRFDKGWRDEQGEFLGWNKDDALRKKRQQLNQSAASEYKTEAPEVQTVDSKTLRSMSAVYDPEAGAKAVRLKDGSVVMDTSETHHGAAIEAINMGLIDKVAVNDESIFGRVWGPEKAYYTEAEFAEMRRLKSEREAALVEAETMERAAQIASDAAAQANAPTDPNVKTGAMALLKHAKEGGSSVNFDLDKLPNVKEEWKHYGSLKYMYEKFVLKPFNHLLTPDQQSNLRWTIGEYNKVLRDGIAEATEFRAVLERIFPYLTPEQRAKGEANLAYQAQIYLGLAETKYSKGDRVLTQDNKAWEITRKTSDGKWVIESGKEVRTVPEDALKAYGPLQREAARQGFTPDQLHALDVGIRDFLNTIHARAVTAGAMKADSYIKDYFIRAFKPPPGWEKVRVEGFLKTFLTAEAATNEHALHRVFRLYEEAVSEGFIPATNHVGTMVYNYAVSMAESTARSIARKSSVKQLHELGLTSKVKPNENWIKVEKSQAPEFEDVFIPRDAFNMLRPMLETRGGLDLIDKADKWNHLAKRFGLGLDFYNSMNILRGIVSVGFNPKTIFQLGKYNEYWEKQHPALLNDAIQGGLNLGIPTDYVARDQAFERDTKLAGGESMREAVREGKYGEAPKRALMKARGIFYWIEENAVQNLLETGKKAAFYKDYAESSSKMMKKLGRDLTPIEDQRLIQSTAKNVNTLFGGQNLEQMGRSKMARVGLRMLLLSPDWTESRLRMYATGMHEGMRAAVAPLRAAFGDHAALSALNHENTGNVKYAVRLFAATLLATEAMNLALNQKTTLSNDKGNEFYVQLPMKTKYGTSPAINLWGYQEMPLRLMHHMINMQPEAFLNERQAPALNTAFALLASQDNFGEKLKGEVAFMRPPITEREKNMKIALQKGMLVAGQVIPSVLTDLLVATDRTMRDGAIDSVRFARSVANFIGIKVSSNYPQEIRTKMDFLEENAVRTRGEYKRLISAGQWREAIEMKREWNDEVDALKRNIYSDPTLRTAFRKRTDTITTFKIR